MHFKNSTRQYPDFALAWEPWQEMDVTLELQLLADIGLIGTPSVGKSSLINAVSNTKAKVAEYHFTTLIPQLWSVKHNIYEYNVIDIPWLIDWAHAWKWLWDEFLRHILKTSVFSFVVDISRFDDGIKELGVVRNEVKLYLLDKFSEWYNTTEIDIRAEIVDNMPYIIVYAQWEPKTRKVLNRVVNKIDEIEDTEIQQEYIDQLTTYIQSLRNFDTTMIQRNMFCVSAIFGTWIDSLKNHRWMIVNQHITTLDIQEQPVERVPRPYCTQFVPDDVETQLVPEEISFIEKEDLIADEEDEEVKHYREISHPELSRLVSILPRWNIQAELWFWKTLDRERILQWIRKHGIRHGDVLKIVTPYNTTKYIEYKM